MTRLEEKIDRNQNDIDQFSISMKIMEDKLNNSTTDIARLEKNMTDQFHTVENEIGHVKNNFKNIVPQLKTDLRKGLKVEFNGILKQEISVIQDNRRLLLLSKRKTTLCETNYWARLDARTYMFAGRGAP